MNAEALKKNNSPDLTAAKDLLIVELQIFEEAIRHSEDTGEKRFSFFMTLATAVVGGLFALWIQKDPSSAFKLLLPKIMLGASFGLLVFGILTFLRMVHRDRVTAQLKRTTDCVRAKYRSLFLSTIPELSDLKLPVDIRAFWKPDPDKVTNDPPTNPGPWALVLKGAKKLFRGGYTVTVAIINGALLTLALLVMNLDTLDQEQVRAASHWGISLAIVLGLIAAIPYPDKMSPSMPRSSQ